MISMGPKVYYLGFADEEFGDALPKLKIMQKANLTDGWCKRRNCKFEFTMDKTKADAILHLWEDAKIAAKFPQMRGFSVTDLGAATPRIYFNSTNIKSPPKGFAGSKEDYLDYIVQHELGHAIFKIMEHDEEDQRHPVTKMCSVMYQQTRGTKKCRPGIAFY